ncbi:hypothetical protein R2A130_2422 [Ahrensia sp. R2A130]|nr:hypothetical protein R2A130_2422 [Ahrensia sp. R2A130]
MRVSDLAVDILHPEPGADTAAAVQRAAFAPSLYMDLFERFEVTPSEGALKSYLKRSGFLESAINAVTSAYLETCEYLKQSGATDLSVPSDVTGAESEPQTTNEQVMATMHASKVINTPPPSHAHNAQADILNLTGGGYASLVLPDELSANEFSDLKDWLKLMAKRAKRRIKPVESSAVEQAADKNRTDNSGYLDDPGYLGDGEG